jgi:hypothetical protein
MSNDYIYEGLVEARSRIEIADGLIEEATGWLSDIMADDSTRDGEPPTGKEIIQWVEDWLAAASEYLNGENNE